jgi:UDP:flavonoid glycosyltransferase YjiC (YdhE family)
MKGHLHPALGLAVALAADDRNRVRVLSSSAAQPDIAASGLVGVSLLPGRDDLVMRVANPPHPVRSDPRRLLAQFRAVLDLQEMLQADIGDQWRHEPPDLAIVDFTLPAAGVAALRAGARWWTSCPSPCVLEGRAGPPAYLGGWLPGTTRLGRARDAAGRALTRGFKRTAYGLSRHRLRTLGFDGAYRCDGTEAAYSPERVLALMPPELEFARALPPSVRYVGPVLHTPDLGTPPIAVRPGSRTVLITAGTHLPWAKAELVAAAHELAAVVDVDVHVSLGDPAAALPGPPVDGAVRVLPWVDYARHLTAYDLVAHHGGAGVLAHTLAAGLPAVVTPRDYDQFDHAARLVAAGVALRCRPSSLARTVVRALDDPGLRARAADLGERIRAIPAGAAVAAEVRAAFP